MENFSHISEARLTGGGRGVARRIGKEVATLEPVCPPREAEEDA